MKRKNFYLDLTLVMMVFLLGLCYYGIFRNNRVLKYRSQLCIQSMFVDPELHDKFVDSIYGRYSYNEMFLSFKPMRSEYWFTEDEVAKYNLKLVDDACK